MRSQARLGVTVGALLSTLAFAPARAQSHTEVWAGLSFGLFDGVGIGLTRYHYAHAGGVSVATGTSRNPDYGIYSNDDRGRRSGDYRYGRGRYDRSDADYCWDRAWDLRWGNRYYGWDGYGSPTYDHLDFYHDCLSGGVGYAYSRWDVHQRRSYRYGRPWGGSVQVYVTDPFWRPWGPYWSYDPWGWYWDGFRDGRNGRGWGSRGAVGWSGPGVRTVWTDGRGGWGRRSPLGPGYKEDPTDRRTAVPRTGRAVPVAAPGTAEPIGRGVDEPRTASTRRPAGEGGRSARPGSGGATPGREEPGVRAPEREAERSPSPRSRPTDGLRGAGRARPAAAPEGGDAGDARRGVAAPRTPRARPSEGKSSPDRGEEASERPAPSVRSGGSERAAPATRSGGAERPAPSARSGDAERPAPSARSGGGERSAPSVRSGGDADGGRTARRR